MNRPEVPQGGGKSGTGDRAANGAERGGPLPAGVLPAQPPARPARSPARPARGAPPRPLPPAPPRALTCAWVRGALPRCGRCGARAPAPGGPLAHGKCSRPPAAPEAPRLPARGSSSARRSRAPSPTRGGGPPASSRVLRARFPGLAGRFVGICAAEDRAEAWR